jgi:aspartyl-tRNA(Asn)/glutamyl-tRNA(Gln) amidotransferase subunit A
MPLANIPLTIACAQKALASGSLTSVDLIRHSVDVFEADKDSPIPLNAFLEIYDDAIDKAKAADAEIGDARKTGNLDALFAAKPL